MKGRSKGRFKITKVIAIYLLALALSAAIGSEVLFGIVLIFGPLFYLLAAA